MEDMCMISVTMVEREGTPAENRVERTLYFNTDALILHEDVLPTFETALRGFGFGLDGKHLEVVEDES